MSQDQTTPQDPKEQYPQPPFPEQDQEMPGSEQQMTPKPDHGQESYKGSGRLEGRVAVITGTDSGIGKAVAIAFAREGADVVISYLNEDEDARETQELVEQAGRKALLIPGDISQEAHCQGITQQTIDQFGKIDILVNNAAYQMSHQSIQEFTAAEIQHTYATNVFSMFYLCKSALQHMQPGGSIINTCSVEAFKPEPYLLAYASTKAAIVNFTKGLAQQTAEQGIRVNSVAPGPVWTPLIPGSMPPEQVSQFGQQSPLGRAAQPAELAPAYVFLGSQEASYVTGETLGVHGGMPVGT
ncbi:MAG: SDR family oxidoreductase [Chloroflexota bacterium]|nr:SDR family oxidoreductase [Chloroflexota bacterium]